MILSSAPRNDVRSSKVTPSITRLGPEYVHNQPPNHQYHPFSSRYAEDPQSETYVPNGLTQTCQKVMSSPCDHPPSFDLGVDYLGQIHRSVTPYTCDSSFGTDLPQAELPLGQLDSFELSIGQNQGQVLRSPSVSSLRANADAITNLNAGFAYGTTPLKAKFVTPRRTSLYPREVLTSLGSELEGEQHTKSATAKCQHIPSSTSIRSAQNSASGEMSPIDFFEPPAPSEMAENYAATQSCDRLVSARSDHQDILQSLLTSDNDVHDNECPQAVLKPYSDSHNKEQAHDIHGPQCNDTGLTSLIQPDNLGTSANAREAMLAPASTSFKPFFSSDGIFVPTSSSGVHRLNPCHDVVNTCDSAQEISDGIHERQDQSPRAALTSLISPKPIQQFRQTSGVETRLRRTDGERHNNALDLHSLLPELSDESE